MGFGTALVAVPPLILLLGLPTAIPLVALVMLTNIAAVLWNTRDKVDVRAAWQLLLSSLVGIPIGLVLLRMAPDDITKALLGAVLIAYSLYNLTRPELPTIEHQAWVLPFGFLSGILGGAYNINGPPVVLYAALRGWPPDRFRATLQGYFFPAAILICGGHAMAGLWSLRVFKLYALALPVVVPALMLGTRLGRAIPADRFGRAIYAILIVFGAMLFV